jgi:hypothetical protein
MGTGKMDGVFIPPIDLLWFGRVALYSSSGGFSCLRLKQMHCAVSATGTAPLCENPEQAEIYLANDPELLAHYRSRRRTTDPSTLKNKKPGAQARAGQGVSSCRHLLQGGHDI